jgi:hypothetical protein
MKARYKYKVGELVEFYLPDNETPTQTTFIGVIFHRERERINGWTENVYDVLIQGEYNRHGMKRDQLRFIERYLEKVK